MPAAAPVPPSTPLPPPRHRVKAFWERVTEGLELNQLWTQFHTEARSSYGLYSRELRRDDLAAMTPFQRALHLAKAFFWAVLMKLSPARRVVLLVGLTLMILSLIRVQSGEGPSNYPPLAFWGGLVILALLVLEVADRVTMKRDLQIAREIQQWLVPEQAPPLPNTEVAFVTRPANTVAGDYYDVFPLESPNGPRALLAVADVAGKSLPAALLMATFQASLRTLAVSSSSLPELVAGVNRYACAHRRGGQRFTTAFLAILNATTGELTYINAGHNAPLLRRASGALERLDAGGVPLGIGVDRPYACAQIKLEPGDLLVIFTDGVVEAVNPRGEEYEEGRLISVVTRSSAISAREVLNAVMSDVDRFVAQASQYDDITCMVVRRVAGT